MFTLETFRKTAESYREAYERLFELGTVTMSGSGNPYVDLMASPQVSCSIENAAAHASNVRIRTDRLFDMGEPIRVKPTFWLWKCSFMEIWFQWDIPWSTYHWIPKQVRIDRDGEGEETPAHEIKRDYTITADLGKASFGLGEWETNKKKIARLVETSDDKVRETVGKAVAEADEEVRRWLDAINNSPKVELA